MSFEMQLKVRSDGIADHLLAKKFATQAEIDACGITDVDDPEMSLILRYGDLRALLAQRVPDANQRSERLQQADRVVLDALRGAPKSVALSDPTAERREVSVQPKSLNALIELAERDVAIGFFNSAIDALRETNRAHPTAERVDHLARAVREVAYQERLCAWIVTHPGPGLPYPEADSAPTLPAWLNDLSPVDMLMIFTAHEEVNAGRLAALQALPRGKRKRDDVQRGWGVFLANLASDQRSAEQLARDHSLAALFAQNYVSVAEQERQMEAAER